MESQQDRKPPEQPRPAEAPPAPKKRFRLVKLEERIAPSRGGKGTNNCIASSTSGETTGGCSGSAY